jgi:hypothetical protein
MKTITATIREDQAEWLHDHPSVNVSGALQEKIDELKRRLGEKDD